MVGQNGIGKSTALKILAGKQKPNLGRFTDPPDWTEILTYFRGKKNKQSFIKIFFDTSAFDEKKKKTFSHEISFLLGSELQNYFTKILEDDLKALIKPQYVDQIPKAVKGSVATLLDRKDDRKNQQRICEMYVEQ